MNGKRDLQRSWPEGIKESKYYFCGEEVVKVIHLLYSENKAIVFNLDKQVEQIVNLTGARNVYSPALRIGDVARIFNCQPDTVRKWEWRGYIEPIQQWQIGKRKIRFYKLSDVENIREIIGSVHRGRPRKDGIIKSRYPAKGNMAQIAKDIRKRYGNE